MDFGNFADSIILLVSGAIIALYGAGKLFPKLADRGTGIKDKKNTIFMIGLVIFIAGIVQLVRHIL
jgi:hypothetical protein